MSQKDNKIAKIEEIYKKFSQELLDLKKEQNNLIDDYIFKLEEKKKKNLRKKLN